MNDWNGNGKYDLSDQYLDYQGADSGSSCSLSECLVMLILLGIVTVCPILGIIIILIILSK